MKGLQRPTDTYGSLALNKFLADYKRITIPKVCIPGALGNLVVWVNRTGRWEKLSASKISALGEKNQTSLCRALVTRLGLNSSQFEAIRDVFHDANSTERMGLYQHQSDPQEYALVLRLPPSNLSQNLLAGGAGAGAVLLGYNAKQLRARLASKKENSQIVSFIESPEIPVANDMLTPRLKSVNQGQFQPELKDIVPVQTQIAEWGDAIKRLVLGSRKLNELIIFNRGGITNIHPTAVIKPDGFLVAPMGLFEIDLLKLRGAEIKDMQVVGKNVMNDIKPPYIAWAFLGYEHKEELPEMDMAREYVEKVKNEYNVQTQAFEQDPSPIEKKLSSIAYWSKYIVEAYDKILQNAAWLDFVPV